MSRELREELRRRTAEARTRYSSHGDRSEAGEIGHGFVGQVYAIDESGGLPVEWAVLEAADRQRLLAVPLDDQPLAGAADVAVRLGPEPPSGLRAPSVLRCAFAVELDRRWLEARHATGFVPQESVRQALELYRRLAADGATEAFGSAIGREIETEPEYRHWIEDVVEPAAENVRRAASFRRDAEDVRRDAEASRFTDARNLARPQRSTPRWRGMARQQLWAIAASLLLGLSSVLVWQLLRLGESHESAVRAAAAPAEELRRQNADLQQRLADAVKDRLEARAEEEDQSPPVAVDRTLGALINVPLAVLVSGVRGEPEIVRATAEDPWIGLVIELRPGQRGPFSLEITPLGGGPPVFSAEGLRASRGLVSVLLPREELPAAAYRLRLESPAVETDSSLAFTLIVEGP